MSEASDRSEWLEGLRDMLAGRPRRQQPRHHQVVIVADPTRFVPGVDPGEFSPVTDSPVVTTRAGITSPRRRRTPTTPTPPNDTTPRVST